MTLVISANILLYIYTHGATWRQKVWGLGMRVGGVRWSSQCHKFNHPVPIIVVEV